MICRGVPLCVQDMGKSDGYGGRDWRCEIYCCSGSRSGAVVDGLESCESMSYACCLGLPLWFSLCAGETVYWVCWICMVVVCI